MRSTESRKGPHLKMTFEFFKTLPPELATALREVVFLAVVGAATFVGMRLITRSVRWLEAKLHASALSLNPLSVVGRALVLIIVVGIVTEHYFAVDVYALIGGLIALIGVGFVAVWSTLSNALCSLLLLSSRPFEVGDEIELPPDPVRGRVIDLSLFFTTLEAPDGRLVQLPNNLFFQRIIVRKPATGAVPLAEHLSRKAEPAAPATAAVSARAGVGELRGPGQA